MFRNRDLVILLIVLCAAARINVASAQSDAVDYTLFRWNSQAYSANVPDRSEIETDRPDFTEASSVVGLGAVQIENGYTFSRDKSAGIVTEDHSYPETLCRFGFLREWLELRVAYNHGTSDTLNLRSSGSEDFYLGTKLALTLQDGFLPEMALVPQMTVPTGSDDRSAGKALPGFNWLYGWDVGDRMYLAGSTQWNVSQEAAFDNRYSEFAQSGTIGFGLTDKLGCYNEFFCLCPSGASEVKPEYYYNGGLTFKFTSNVQADVRAGVGLNEAAQDFFVGPGLSMRFR
jgi:hypothetical protein